MNSEIQETIAEIRAIIQILKIKLTKYELNPEDKEAKAETNILMQDLMPLLKKLEEHILVMEKKND